MAKNMEIAWLFDFYGEMLTDKQRNVFELYYEEDLSLAEIAESQDITRQGVRDSIKRAEAQMLEMEERLHVAARFRAMRDGLEAIRDIAHDIERLSEQTPDVCAGAARIAALAEDLRER